MEKITDWNALWRELSVLHIKKGHGGAPGGGTHDAWQDRAKRYDRNVKERWSQRDSSRDTIVSHLTPQDTVLDIGAGTGRWSLYLAPYAQHVTALDPSPSMLEVLRGNIAEQGLSNVSVIEGAWPEAVDRVEPHDITLCAHAMYGTPNLPQFVRAMMSVTRKMCFLVMRFPLMDAVVADLARHIVGQPHDSANGVLAYNILVDMGVYPHVLMEDSGLWKPWTNATFEEAVQETKRRFGLPEDTPHDEYIRKTLAGCMTQLEDGTWRWPAGTRSGLIYWHV